MPPIPPAEEPPGRRAPMPVVPRFWASIRKRSFLMDLRLVVQFGAKARRRLLQRVLI